MTDLENMRKVAEAATPGPWSADDEWVLYEGMLRPSQNVYSLAKDPEGRLICNVDVWKHEPEGRHENAEFIATFDPPTVLSLLDQITALEEERDALLGAAGFKPGPVKDVVLADLAGMRPAMVKARRQQREVESDAMLWQMASHERGHFGGEGLLWAVWQQRKEAEKRAKAAEAKAEALREIGPMLTCAETLLKSAGFWVNAAGHMTDAAVWIDRAQAVALLNREG